MQEKRIEEWHADLKVSEAFLVYRWTQTHVFPEIQISVGSLRAEVFQPESSSLADSIVAQTLLVVDKSDGFTPSIELVGEGDPLTVGHELMVSAEGMARRG